MNIRLDFVPLPFVWELPELFMGSTAMYAFMALAGDLGCSSGLTVVGMVANAFNGDFRKGFLCALIFPIVMLFGMSRLRVKKA